ncbi:hypothetical protein RDV64_09135 [Acuticoccus sp. MNP-M23]|uniref:hypothetical protein n=1 Tax=Acuticoccus sp. MNP-M23 TaxID=3072793 RepID=UPI002814E697|nr:hypothetical protein [Acuticoccus sp. MNP-M23]WMS44528.1 hypothetical protein RDV64_09135 [Acuticoccus sp. MNP-M23]
MQIFQYTGNVSDEEAPGNACFFRPADGADALKASCQHARYEASDRLRWRMIAHVACIFGDRASASPAEGSKMACHRVGTVLA